MQTILDTGLIWWITAVDLPALSALFWLNFRARKDLQDTQSRLQTALDIRTSQLREGLAAFKLEVAKTYSPVAEMKDLERRITAHLLRIESKLDQTALKTEALRGKTK